MISKTDKSTAGTSFFGTEFLASKKTLISVFGEPDFKEGMIWVRELNDEDVFTIFYHISGDVETDDVVSWRVGGFSKRVTEDAKYEIITLLYTYLKYNNYAKF